MWSNRDLGSEFDRLSPGSATDSRQRLPVCYISHASRSATDFQPFSLKKMQNVKNSIGVHPNSWK